MGHKKLIPIALSLCLAGSVTGLAAVVARTIMKVRLWAYLPPGTGATQTAHAAVYADYEGNVVVEHTGTMGNTTAAARSMWFGSKWISR